MLITCERCGISEEHSKHLRKMRRKNNVSLSLCKLCVKKDSYKKKNKTCSEIMFNYSGERIKTSDGLVFEKIEKIKQCEKCGGTFNLRRDQFNYRCKHSLSLNICKHCLKCLSCLKARVSQKS